MNDIKNFLILFGIILVTLCLIFISTKYIEKIDTKDILQEEILDNESNDTNKEDTIKKSSLTKESFKSKNETVINYWLYKPVNNDNNSLIIYLHGGSSKGNNLDLLIKDVFPKYIYDYYYGNISSYIIMPQLDSEYKGWSDIDSGSVTLNETNKEKLEEMKNIYKDTNK